MVAVVRTLLVALLIAPLLAGCTGGSANAGKDSFEDLEEQASKDVKVQATKTTGVIRGIVVDDLIRPVVDAEVRLMTTPPQTTKTSSTGGFGFEELEPGTYFVKVSAQGYASTQSSADVTAGVDDPPLLRVLLTAVYVGEPSFETIRHAMHLTASGWANPGGGVTCCFVDGVNRSWFFNMDFASNGTQFVQVITTWEPTVSVFTDARVFVQLSSADDTLGDNISYGPSPGISNFYKGQLAEMTDPIHIYGSIYAYPADPLPVALAVEQDYTIYAIATNNFSPGSDYRWDLDGDPQIPD